MCVGFVYVRGLTCVTEVHSGFTKDSNGQRVSIRARVAHWLFDVSKRKDCDRNIGEAKSCENKSKLPRQNPSYNILSTHSLLVLTHPEL